MQKHVNEHHEMGTNGNKERRENIRCSYRLCDSRCSGSSFDDCAGLISDMLGSDSLMSRKGVLCLRMLVQSW